MFKCYHCGGCCEDVCTQINLTLGDIERLCKRTGKSAFRNYKEGKIGVYPFGDPFKLDEYETDVGLSIPCCFRRGKRGCSIYDARPLNCRLFPYWILSDAPAGDIKKLICPGHECMEHFEIDNDFPEDRKIYHAYKEKIVKVLMHEIEVSDRFYEKIGLKKIIKARRSKCKKDDLKVISELVAGLRRKDLSQAFRKIDSELKKHHFAESDNLPILI